MGLPGTEGGPSFGLRQVAMLRGTAGAGSEATKACLTCRGRGWSLLHSDWPGRDESAGYPGRGTEVCRRPANVRRLCTDNRPAPALFLRRADLALTRASPASPTAAGGALRRPWALPGSLPPPSLAPAALLRFRGGGDGPPLPCPPRGRAAGAPAQTVTAWPQPEVQGLGSQGIYCKTFCSAPKARMKTP